MFAQTGVGFVGSGSSIVGDINGQSKGLGNIIDWNPNQNLLFSSTAKVDISRSILDSSNKFGDYTTMSQNVPLSNNSVIDYNIDMNNTVEFILFMVFFAVFGVALAIWFDRDNE